MSFRFERHQGTATGPRRGTLHTPHGAMETPAFMPVATRGMMRGILPTQLEELGSRMVLANAFHLYARPGVELVHHVQALEGVCVVEELALADDPSRPLLAGWPRATTAAQNRMASTLA